MLRRPVKSHNTAYPRRRCRCRRHRRRSLKYHISFLLTGFCQSASPVTSSHMLLPLLATRLVYLTLFGVMLPFIATTLPEKFIALLWGFESIAEFLLQIQLEQHISIVAVQA